MSKIFLCLSPQENMKAYNWMTLREPNDVTMGLISMTMCGE